MTETRQGDGYFGAVLDAVVHDLHQYLPERQPEFALGELELDDSLRPVCTESFNKDEQPLVGLSKRAPQSSA